ncbi:gas vesicle protein GvpO [Thalassobacillus sp. CUG 92003]|uniref:gas vesicle protein GvpO n=1 Tax=Thalassobacillus sp. CUG 92003 TaxID=2736641 RepID=UPI0015E750F0|nr:gas vesicle protein GvpO [Thalassobacillus sp. CUG 92003]
MIIMDNVTHFFNEHIAPPHKITSVEKQSEEEGWRVTLEVIEEKDYMKRYAHDEMVGLYEVYVDKDMEITGFSRIHLRYRSDLEETS